VSASEVFLTEYRNIENVEMFSYNTNDMSGCDRLEMDKGWLSMVFINNLGKRRKTICLKGSCMIIMPVRNVI
jgi:hypothetical protein